jgi:hypothetical protein
MSHHLSGPNLRSPADDARLDLTDVYVFPAPAADRTVLVMNVNPDFGGFADAFHPIGPHTNLLWDFPYLGHPHRRSQ